MTHKAAVARLRRELTRIQRATKPPIDIAPRHALQEQLREWLQARIVAIKTGQPLPPRPVYLVPLSTEAPSGELATARERLEAHLTRLHESHRPR